MKFIIDGKGNKVCVGLFEFHDTHGFPLELAVDVCIQHDILPGFADFISDAVRKGWKEEKARRTVRSAINESLLITEANKKELYESLDNFKLQTSRRVS